MKRVLSFVVLFVSTIILLNPQKSFAQGVSIGYAPTSEYLNLQPGETYTGFFNAWNLSESDTIYYIYISGFEQVQEFPGTAIPLSPEDDAKDPYSGSSWVSMDITEVLLESQKSEDIYYTVKVPTNIALGEYHVKIFLSTNKQLEEDYATAAVANLASGPNILVQVGDKDKLTETADLLKFTTDKYFYEKPPVEFITELENTGNTHITPNGDIVVTNFLGKEVFRVALNPSDISTLRGQTAKYLNEWVTNRQVLAENKALMFGPMKAELIATYKSVNPGFSPILSETTFWIIPWKLLLAIIVATIVLIFVLSSRKKEKKKSKNE